MLHSGAEPHGFSELDPHQGLETRVHSPSDAITVPDSDLLFSGDFKRSGNDLILTDAKQKFVVRDYFLHDTHPALLSPKGSVLRPEIVAALAGPLAPGQYAQATAPKAQADAIGRVVSASGDVVAIRNGVTITLHAGDALLKGDVLQTGSDSKLAVTFNDGATFDLGANARIVLTEFVYNPNGSDNSSVVSLVKGQLSFIAGQIAHTGDMKVETPVATMGIRGTVGILAYGDRLTLTVANEHDGQIHSIEIRDPNGNVIGHATSNGGTWQVTATGPAQVIGFETIRELNPTQDLQVVQTLLNLQSVGQQIIQQLQQDAQSHQSNGSSSSLQVTVEKQNNSITKVTTSSTSDDNGGPGGGSGGANQGGTPDQYTENPTNSHAPPSFVDSPTVTRVQVAGLNGVGPAVSADGRYIVFLATDKLPGQHDGSTGDAYIYDRATNTLHSMTEHVIGTDQNSPLHMGEKIASVPSVSGDGHYVVFAGQYELNPNDPNSATIHETFIYDSRTGITTLLSGNGDAPVISADGSYVAVASTVYVSSQSSQPIEQSVVNVIDRATGQTVDQIAVGVNSNNLADAGIHDPALSADGKYITFWTTAKSIDIDFGTQQEHYALANANGTAQVYLVDLSAPMTAPVLVSGVGGVAGLGNSGALFVSIGPSVTTPGGADYIFDSSDFQIGDQGGSIFITSLPTQGALFNGTHQITASDVGSGYAISLADIDAGHLVFKQSAAANSDVAGYGTFSFHDSNGGDPQTMTVNLGHDDEWASSMSADGRYIVFESNATDLGAANDHANVYLFDAATGVTTLVSHDTGADTTKYGDSLRPQISADGRYITYVSFATDLIANSTITTNGAAETYLYDRVTGQTTLVSGLNTAAANGDSQWGAAISGGGIFDVFGSTTTNIGGPYFVFTNVHSQAVGGATQLTGLSVSDSNAAGTVTVTIVATDGTLASLTTSPLPAGLTVSGGGTNPLTIKGSLALVNSALQTGLTYTQGSGTHTLTMTVTDPFGGVVSQNVTVPAQGQVQLPAPGTASILISDQSHGTQGVVLDTQVASVLTTQGSLAFTDSGTHTVKTVATPGNWGTLTATVSADTQGSGRGEVTWTYHVNEALAATLPAGALHQDTFAVQLTGSGGTSTEYVTVVVAGTNESLPGALESAALPFRLTVLTPGGNVPSQSALDAFATEMVNSTQTAGTTKFVNTAAGHTFTLVGTDFTYDANGHLNGGTITEIDISDLANNTLLTETGFILPAANFVAAVTANNTSLLGGAFNPVDPVDAAGSTGHDTIIGTDDTLILIGGGGGDTLQAGNGPSILVGGPGGDGLPASSFEYHSLTPVTTATPLTVDSSLLAAIRADATLALTIVVSDNFPADAKLSIGGVPLMLDHGRVTLTPTQLANVSSLTITSPTAGFSLQMEGTTNEGGVFIGGTGANTFVLGAHDGAETITNFTSGEGDKINLAAIPSIQSADDVKAHATQVGADTIIDFSYLPGFSTEVTLQNVNKDNLSNSDFVFAQSLPSDNPTSIVTNSPLGTTFILSGAVLLSNSSDPNVSFGAAPGAYGTLTQDLADQSKHLALTSAAYSYLVASTTDGTVKTFTSVAGSTLDVAAGTFTITDGTGEGTNAGTNAGTLEVSDSGVLNLTGPVDNTGTVEVAAGGTLNFIDADLTGGHVNVDAGGTFDASGTSSLNDTLITNAGTFEVTGGTLTIDPTTIANDGGTITVDSGTTLDLVDSSITAGDLVIDGTVRTTDTDALHSDAFHDVAVDNNNTLEVVSGTLTLDQATTVRNKKCGTLTLDQATAVANTGGTITVDSGATLALDTATVTDGDLAVEGTVTASGADALHNVAVDNNADLEVTGGTLTLDQATAVANTGGTITVDSGATLALDTATVTDGDLAVEGTVTASGADALHNVAVDNNADLEVTGGTLTLDQATAVANTGGTITVDSGATLALDTATVTDGDLAVEGTVTASGADALHNVAVDNNADLEVTGGTLTLDQATAVANTGGTITVDSGATLALDTATVTDGDLAVEGTVTASGADALHNVAVDNNADLEVTGGTLTLDQATAVANTGGTITVDSGATLALDTATVTDGDLAVEGTVTASGADALHNVAVDNNADLEVTGGTLTLDQATAVANTGGTITVDSGATLALDTATVTDGDLAVEGTVTASGADALHNVAVDNNADLEVTGGTLTLDQATAVANTGGTITVDSGATLALDTATVTDGDLAVEGTVTASGADALHNVAVDNNADLEVTGGTLTLDQATAVANTGGTITVDSGATLALDTATVTDGDLAVEGTVTASGADALHNVAVDNNADLEVTGGTLTLDQATAVANTGGTITVDSGATLALDTATVTDGDLAVEGTVTASGADALHNVAVDNNADLEVTGGTLTLDQATAVANTGGTITVDSGATLALDTATVTDGDLAVEGTVTASGADALHNVAVDNNADLEVTGGTLTLDQATAVANTGGTITVDSGATLALDTATVTDGDLAVEGTVTASGADALHNVAVDNNADLEVTGGTLTLDQATAVANTGGTITVDSGATLALDTATVTDGDLAVEGTVTASGADALHNVAVDNNADLEVTGGTLTLDQATAVANTGGTITVDSGATLALDTATVTDGDLAVEGTVTASGADALHNVAVDNNADLEVTGGTLTLDQATAVANTGGTITVDSGATLALDTATVTDGDLAVEGTVTASGADALHNVAVDNNADLEVTGGTLTLDQATAVANTGGTITVDSGATLALDTATVTDGDLAVEGTVTASGADALHNVAVDNNADLEVTGGTLTLDQATAVANTGGTITVDSGATLALDTATVTDGDLAVEGTVTASGADALHNVAVDNNADLEVTGGTLTLDQATAVANTGGTITVDSGATLALDTATVTDGDLAVEGTVTASGADALHNVAVDNNADLEVTGGTLTLDQATAVANTGGTITVDSGATLALDTATVTDGDLAVEGTVTASGADALHNVAVDNNADLEVTGGTLTLDQATAVANTGGTITVDSGATLALDTATVTDGDLAVEGTVTASGADALHNVAVDNNADLEVTGGTLTLDQATAVANTGGTITVDSGATLALDTATVTDGDLAVEGTVTASGADALHNVAVDNNADLEVTGGTLTLDQATAVANTGGTITVDSGATLALDTATVTDGDLAVEGTVTASGADALHNVAVDNNADLEVTGGTLTLDQATAVANTGGTITVDSGATLALDTATVTDGDLAVEGTVTASGADALHNVAVDNNADLEVTGGTLTLDQATAVANTGGTITVDSGATLALDTATVTDGDLAVEGTVTASGADALHNVAVDNNADLEVTGGTLTLDQATAVANTGGTITVDSGATLALDTATVTDGDLAVEGR